MVGTPRGAQRHVWIAASILFCVGCAMTVKEVSLSEDPDYFLVGSTEGEAKSIFSASDEKVTLRVVFAPNFVGSSRTFTVEWFGPDGSVYLREPAKTQWGSNETLFAALDIAGSEPSRMPGSWRVRLLYEGAELANRPFTIE